MFLSVGLPSVFFPFVHSHHQCPGKCTEGAVYYRYENFGKITSFQEALDKTPNDCVLSPVESLEELLDIISVIPTNSVGSYASNTWVGMGKSAAEVVAAATNLPKSLRGWFNLDGSEVPADIALWAQNEPNNAENYQTRAYVDGGGRTLRLGDMTPQGFREASKAQVHAAVYKCCYDLCPKVNED